MSRTSSYSVRQVRIIACKAVGVPEGIGRRSGQLFEPAEQEICSQDFPYSYGTTRLRRGKMEKDDEQFTGDGEVLGVLIDQWGQARDDTTHPR